MQINNLPMLKCKLMKQQVDVNKSTERTCQFTSLADLILMHFVANKYYNVVYHF